ncbi:hypothetical protein HHI36_001832 [Cryptolaemus montrouzieri]|uniref:Uncharacterized protein n=1 Tax=Cryptolaemus montrouzieri TaxID=559131 RepID=A0ABD2P8R2_9CUCU
MTQNNRRTPKTEKKFDSSAAVINKVVIATISTVTFKLPSHV